MRPLVVRGYIRLALFVGALGSILYLLPHIGMTLAFVASMAAFLAAFALLRYAVDL